MKRETAVILSGAVITVIVAGATITSSLWIGNIDFIDAGKTIPTVSSNESTIPTKDSFLEDVEDTISNLDNGSSVRSLMSAINKNEELKENKESSYLDAKNYFESGHQLENNHEEKIYNRIKVTAKKWTCGNDKIGGEIYWTWYYEHPRKNKGFVAVIKAKTNANKKAFLLTGVFYLLEKNSSNEWEVKHQKELITDEEGKIITSSNFNKDFPHFSVYHPEIPSSNMFLYGNNLEFIKNPDKLNNLCDQSQTSNMEQNTYSVNLKRKYHKHLWNAWWRESDYPS